MIPQYNNTHPQSQYMQHPQYMQQKMPVYNDNMGTSALFNPGNPVGNVNQMPANRLPPQQPLQQQHQQHQLQQQLNQSHPQQQQPMIDTAKYSNHSNHYPFVGNTNYFYQGGNNSNSSSNNNINKKN